MADEAPWLYDVDEEDEARARSNAQQDQQELLSAVDKRSCKRQLQGEQQLLNGQACALVRCHGVHANGVPCSRTSWLPIKESDKASKANKYCYRHRYQQLDHRTALSSTWLPGWCSCRQERNNRSVTTAPRAQTASRVKVCAAMCCLVISVGCFITGVYKQNTSLCLVGAVGTWCSAVAMCIVTCENVCSALPIALAAQLTLDSLQAQLTHLHPTARSGGNSMLEDRIASVA